MGFEQALLRLRTPPTDSLPAFHSHLASRSLVFPPAIAITVPICMTILRHSRFPVLLSPLLMGCALVFGEPPQGVPAPTVTTDSNASSETDAVPSLPDATAEVTELNATVAVPQEAASNTETGDPPSNDPPSNDPPSNDPPSDETTEQTSENDQLMFSFNAVPWRDVITWLADEADLALHFSELPTGSFTYSDPNAFAPQEAIERVNLFLLSEGYTLVRSGKLLSVINLADPRGLQKLDVLARLVSVNQLAEESNHDVVKCVFPLGQIQAEDAVQELSALNLMSTPAVLSKTNQLMITDTVAKLQSVRAVLAAFETPEMSNGTVVQNFALDHVSAEDVLVVARPHLGLATDEMIGIDISLSADLQGKNLFVTGVEDKVKLIEGLVKAIDVPQPQMNTQNGEMVLRSYVVGGGNVETIYNVLQTLLARQSVRLSMDETAGSIVALAAPSVHQEIAATVSQLEADVADFEVIPLKTVDPYFVISLLEEMLDIPGPLDKPVKGAEAAPKIDADPGNMRLFVRGKKQQIDQIKKIVAGLETGNVPGDSEGPALRIVPLAGRLGEQALETAARFWRGPNPILYYPTAKSPADQSSERVPNDPAVEPASPLDQSAESSVSPRLLSSTGNSQAPMIRCQLSPRGLLLQSDDIAALDKFESQLRALVGPMDSEPVPPVVFYLKHSKPADALRMLRELIDGGEMTRGSEANSLVKGYVSSSSEGASMFGSMMTSDEGTTTMMAGSITVVADSRLNRLIAQGTAADIELIEDYLKIIDKDRSITSIETYGTPHVIELTYTRADEVAEAIREAFAGRILTDNQNGQGRGGAANAQAAQQAQREAEARQRAEEKKGIKPTQNPATRDLEPKLTVAVHEPSNSLIVTAPPQLFAEVEQLALAIDARGEQSITVVAPSSSAAFGAVLEELLQGEGSSSDQRPTSRTSSSQRSRVSR